jgi:hypothetical protein
MSEQSLGSSYLVTGSSSENREGSGGKKMSFAYTPSDMTNQAFILLPDTGEWKPYASQNLRLHNGAIEIYVRGDEISEKGPRKRRVLCKGKECPVCRDLDKKYAQIKDQPFMKQRRHIQLFVVVPVTFKHKTGQYIVDKTVAPMQVEYAYRWNSVDKKMVNVEFEDLGHAIKSLMQKGVNPFDTNAAVIFERTREMEPSPMGKGTRKVWRHAVVEGANHEPMTVALPHDILDQVKRYYPLDQYAFDYGIPDLQVMVDVGNQQAEIVESLKASLKAQDLSAVNACHEALSELAERLHHDVSDVGFRKWLESAEKYAAKMNDAKESEESEDVEGASESLPTQKPYTAPAASSASPPRAISTPATTLAAAAAADPVAVKPEGVTPLPAPATMSEADRIKAKWNIRR